MNSLTIVWKRDNGVRIIVEHLVEEVSALESNHTIHLYAQSQERSYIPLKPNMPLMERIRNATTLMNDWPKVRNWKL